MIRRAFTIVVWSASAVILGLVYLGVAQADMRPISDHINTTAAPAKSLEDIIAQVPLIGNIPHSFLFAGEHRFNLTGKELRIDHMGPNSQSSIRHRACMICLTWATPVAFFGSEIELPIFHAEMLHFSDWRMSSLGDYVVHLSKDAVDTPWVGLKATLHF